MQKQWKHPLNNHALSSAPAVLSHLFWFALQIRDELLNVLHADIQVQLHVR